MSICSKQGPGGFVAHRRRKAGLHSFSLVELVIAIGIASFVLISLLGLMSYAGQTVQQADKYTRLASVASQTLATLATYQFASGPYGRYATVGAGSGFPANYTQTNYFTFEGLPTNSVNGTTIYYQVNIADPYTAWALLPYRSNGQPLMEPLQISIFWPASSGSPFANTNIIVTSILNYDTL